MAKLNPSFLRNIDLNDEEELENLATQLNVRDRRYRQELDLHPNCEDPHHPGCPDCREDL